MQVNQVNNSQSFGMAFKVNTKSFAKANPQEAEKVAEIVKQVGQKQLDEASNFVNCQLTAGMKDGKVKDLVIIAFSKGLKEMFQQTRNLIYSRVIGKEVKDLDYLQAIKIEDLTPAKLLESVEKTSKAALDRFGSTERAKTIFGEK